MRTGIRSGLAMLCGLLVACGTSTEPAAPPETTASTSSTTTAPKTTTTAASPVWSGPPTLLTVHSDDLVAIDLQDRSQQRTLADRGKLAASLDVIEAHIDGIDLSPDGSAVAFTLNGQIEDRLVSALYEVPTDGSAEPRRIDVEGAEGGFSQPEYSPDGRLLAVWAGERLVVLPAAGGAPVSPGLTMPYPPAHLVWSPGGDRLLWLPHYERSSCCSIASVYIDPSTGAIVSDVDAKAADGRPYFDASGTLRTQRAWSHWALDLDASRRYALTVGVRSSGGNILEWWDTTDPDAEARPIELDLDLSEVAPIAW
jgi:dipeptidyl aminopeptidase/acylaminoacyl peptidase